MRTAAWVIGGLALCLALLWVFGPREPFVRQPFDEAALPGDLSAYLALKEAALTDLTPGTEKEIIWAGAPGEATEWAVVYLHGFSATKQEIRPVPDRVAAALGANLYFARFRGHGRPGEALARASAGDWLRDAEEALAIGRRLGRKVLVMATSTGATLATVALADPAAARGVAGLIAVSPNYGIQGAPLWLLTAPFARTALPALLGPERSWEPVSEDHGRFWTTRYPLTAVLTMARTVEAAREAEVEAIGVPALFILSDGDQVVDPAAARRIAARWGGPVRVEAATPGPGDDPSSHVIAGAILSPGMTDPIVRTMLDWVEAGP